MYGRPSVADHAAWEEAVTPRDRPAGRRADAESVIAQAR